MKKFLLAVLVVMMMGMSTICSAASSNGSLLDSEDKIAGRVFAALGGQEEYSTAVAPFMTSGLAKNLTAAKFAEVKGQIAKDFGGVINPKLFALQKMDKADRTIYLADSKKAPKLEISYIFNLTGSKPMLDGFTIRPVEIKKVATAQQPEK